MSHTTAAVLAKSDTSMRLPEGSASITCDNDGPRSGSPLVLHLERDTLQIDRQLIRVMARLPRAGSDQDRVGILAMRVPEGDVKWEPVVVDGKLTMVFGFIPDATRREVAAMFRAGGVVTLA